MTADEVQKVKRLVQATMDQLRSEAFDEGDEQPTSKEYRARFSGWSRAELIVKILEHDRGL